jgi:hypothetical protein
VTLAAVNEERTVCEDLDQPECAADLSDLAGPVTLTVTASSVDDVIQSSRSVDVNVVVP